MTPRSSHCPPEKDLVPWRGPLIWHQKLIREGMGALRCWVQKDVTTTRKSNCCIESFLLLRLSVLFQGAQLEVPYKIPPGIAPLRT